MKRHSFLTLGLPDHGQFPGSMPPQLTEGRAPKVKWRNDPGTCSSALRPLSQCSVGDLWLLSGESEEKIKMRNF